MTQDQLNNAIKIIAESNGVRASFNVPIHDNYGNVYQILIHECNASLTKKLIAEDYKLSMTLKGLCIDKY